MVLLTVAGYIDALKSDDGRIKISTPAPGTSSWITHHPAFVGWLNRKVNSIFWLNGTAGSGKSTLARYLVEESIRQSSSKDWATISYFFNYASPEQRSALGFFRASLSQLLGQIGAVPAVTKFEAALLEEIEDTIADDWLHDPATLEDQLERAILTVVHARKIFIIIDGLDECDQQSAVKVVTFLRRLVRQSLPNSLHVCITSRHDYLLTEGEAQVRVDLENSNDIRNYIEFQARNCKHDCPHQRAQELSNEILRQANGVFTWVRLALSRLTQAFETGENLHEVLYTLPKDLRGLYKSHLERINIDRSIARVSAVKLIGMICIAMRPLTIAELYGLALLPEKAQTTIWDKQDDSQLPQPLDSNVKMFTKVLMKRYAGCVQIVPVGPPTEKRTPDDGVDNQSMIFVHRTLYEFLQDEWFFLSEDCLNPQSEFQGQLHLDMAEKIIDCYNVNLLPPVVSDMERSEPLSTTPFLKYAVPHLTQHLRAAESEKPSAKRFHKFWQRFSGLRMAPWRKLQTAVPGTLPEWLMVESANALHLTCSCDLEESTRAVLAIYRQHDLDLHEYLHAVDARGRTPLSIAAEVGRLGIVRALLESGADITKIDDLHGQSALHWASFAGNDQVIEELIKAGADINDARNGTTPLTQCSAQGYEKCASILLHHGADLSLKDHQRGQSALSLAILNRHHNVVGLLLRYGADVNTKDTYSDFTPLHHAYISRSPDTVRMLLKCGARPFNVESKPNPNRLEMWLNRLLRAIPTKTATQDNKPPRTNELANGNPDCKNTYQPGRQSGGFSTSRKPGGTKRGLSGHPKGDKNTDDNEDQDQRPNKTQKLNTSDDDELVRYACPFYKYDPRTHQRCASKWYHRIDRLKGHLKQAHRIHRCTRCAIVLPDADVLDAHRNAPNACSSVPRVTWNFSIFSAGYDDDQEKVIQQRARGVPPHEKWRRIYEALFPLVTDIPTPYFESLATLPDGPDRLLQDYDNHRQQQDLQDMLFRADLESLIQRQAPSQEFLSLFRSRDQQTREQFLQNRQPATSLAQQAGRDPPPPPQPPPPSIPRFEPLHLQGDAVVSEPQNVIRDSNFLSQFNGPGQQPDSGFHSRELDIPNQGIGYESSYNDWESMLSDTAPNIAFENLSPSGPTASYDETSFEQVPRNTTMSNLGAPRPTMGHNWHGYYGTSSGHHLTVPYHTAQPQPSLQVPHPGVLQYQMPYQHGPNGSVNQTNPGPPAQGANAGMRDWSTPSDVVIRQQRKRRRS